MGRKCRKLRQWLASDQVEVEVSPHFMLHGVWQLLVTVVHTEMEKRFIRTSKTVFALLKVINHCGHEGLVP